VRSEEFSVHGPGGHRAPETDHAPATHPLDNPVLRALTWPQRRFARADCGAVRYPADMSPFCALPDEPGAADWAGAARLVSPGEVVLFPGLRAGPPPGEPW